MERKMKTEMGFGYCCCCHYWYCKFFFRFLLVLLCMQSINNFRLMKKKKHPFQHFISAERMKSRWERMFIFYCLFLIIATRFTSPAIRVCVEFCFCSVRALDEAEISALKIDFIVKYRQKTEWKLEHLLRREFHFIDAK